VTNAPAARNRSDQFDRPAIQLANEAIVTGAFAYSSFVVLHLDSVAEDGTLGVLI
jgi:hypothetical protein